MPPSEWKKIEEQVNKAEKKTREAAQIGGILHEKTGATAYEGAKSVSAEVKDRAKRLPDSLSAIDQVLSEEEGNLDKEAQELLGNVGDVQDGKEKSLERELVSLRWKNLTQALRVDHVNQKKLTELLKKEQELLGGPLVKSTLTLLRSLQQDIALKRKAHQELPNTSPEAFYGLHLKDLKKYRQQLETGKIVETPYVKEQVEDITVHLKAGKPVFLYGHLGTGKTELAMHAAQKFSEKPALVVSGSKNMAASELYGHQVLDIEKIKKEEIDSLVNEIQEKYKEWKGKNPKVSPDEESFAREVILQTYLKQHEGGTVSRFFLGPVYQAMKEGRIVIIDEVNAISHEILISLNHALTRKAGDIVTVQQDSGEKIEVPKGYGVIMTGNIKVGESEVKYVRENMDPAFMSRLYPLNHDYLPQGIKGLPEEVDPEQDQSYLLLLARLMDKNGNITAPKDTPRTLYNLAKYARLTQDVFSGKSVAEEHYAQEAGGSKMKPVLRESVLSLRALDSIVNQWKSEGFKYSIDYYVWKEFVGRSTSATDQNYLYQEAKLFQFFEDTDWPAPTTSMKEWKQPVKIDKIPQKLAEPIEFFGAREAVEMAYGAKNVPERSVWPQIQESEQGINPEQMEEVLEMMIFSEEEQKKLATFEAKVKGVCEREEARKNSAKKRTTP